ncbi:hypothetical protein OIV83_004194 [Microbotryomycetes sp. JL201]|nr:hypothetical protein OIV83_004194 [Microbotryomycetes sp. JL201]
MDPTGCESVPGLASLLPFDLVQMLHFAFNNDTVTRIVNSASNDFFEDDYPPSLATYLETCKRLSFDRACAVDFEPVLSYPNRPNKTPAPRTSATESVQVPKRLTNAMRAGQSPKKLHEVERFSKLARDVLDRLEREHRPTHVIDVGSGRAHLSRALTDSPLNLHVLAVDWSASQTSGADYLTSIKERARELATHSPSLNGDGARSSGSLTTRTSSLDANAIHDLMQTSILKLGLRARLEAEFAFVGIGTDGQRRVGKVNINCTKQQMSYREYKLKALDKFQQTCVYLAEKNKNGKETDHDRSHEPEEESLADVPTVIFGEKAALTIDSLADETDYDQAEHKEWRDALFLLQCYWTVRCWLGPVYESLCVLDRFAYLVEGTRHDCDSEFGSEQGPTVELINLFDQQTGSLRNLALVVR